MKDTAIPKVAFHKKYSPIGFEVIPLQELIARGPGLNPPINHHHRIQFHIIIYVTKGSGTHHIDFEPHPFSPGSLIFISQGQVNAFDLQEDVGGYVLLVTKEYLEKHLIHSDVLALYRLYNFQPYHPVISLQKTGKESFEPLFKAIAEEYGHRDSSAKEDVLRLYLKILLLKTQRVTGGGAEGKRQTEWLLIFGQFNSLLEEGVASSRSVKDYAGKLMISTKHLNTICKAVTGAAAKEYIDNFTVLEVKRQLATSDSSVQEISYDFGFGEPTNFVKYFKKHSGMSPKKFRETFTR